MTKRDANEEALERLRKIEEEQLFDQRTVEQLQELVLRLGGMVDALEKRVRVMEARLERAGDGGAPGEGPVDTDPFGRRSEPT